MQKRLAECFGEIVICEIAGFQNDISITAEEENVEEQALILSITVQKKTSGGAPSLPIEITEIELN